jgi:hypothetical protein
MDDQERLQEARDQFYVSNFDHCAELAEGEKYTRNEWRSWTFTPETSGEVEHLHSKLLKTFSQKVFSRPLIF